MKRYKVTLYFPIGGDPEEYTAEAKTDHEAVAKVTGEYRKVNPTNPCYGKARECEREAV